MLVSALSLWALAAPTPPPPPAPTEAEVERDRLLAELEALRAEHEAMARASDEAEDLRDTLGALLASAEVLLDDRRPRDERVAAAKAMAATGDPRALSFLRAAAGQPDTLVRRTAASSALGFPQPDHAEPARVMLSDRDAPRGVRLEVMGELGARHSPEAARALWAVGSDEEVEAGIRAAALDELRDTYPTELVSFGTPPQIGDALGVTSFVAAGGLAGGILMSSLGVFGQFEAGPALGGVSGSAIGLGTGALYAAKNPVTAGDGLAFASGVSFGLAYGAWTTTAAHGAWRHIHPFNREDVVLPAAGYRALGVLGGGAVGLFSVSRNPTAWDVLEVDTAGYLGSGIALGAAGLLIYDPPEGRFTAPPDVVTTFAVTTSSPARDDELKASKELAAAELVGASAGLATGALLRGRWELGWNDGLFASVLAAEGAWAGTWTPYLLATPDIQDLKGNIRLPTHAFGAAGLALGEVMDVSYRRSLSTALGAGLGNALGAGLPMVVGYDDDRSVAAWMVPAGLVGTAGGFLVDPWIAPTVGDAALVGVSTAVAGSAGLLVGEALDAEGVWIDSGQGTGVGLLAVGVAGIGSYGLAKVAEPRVDDMLVVATAAGWGAGYGVLVPMAISTERPPSVLLWSTAGTELAFTGATAVALRAGLEPRWTVIPQLLGLSGGTLGALFVALESPESQPVALGSVVGGTLGLGLGVAVQTAMPFGGSLPSTALRTDAVVLPRFGHETGASGQPIPTIGCDVVGW